MNDKLTNAPNPPASDPLKPGFSTSEIKIAAVTLFLSTLFAFLAAFNVLTLTDEQKESVYALVGASWVLIPAVVLVVRSWIKKSAVQQPLDKDN